MKAVLLAAGRGERLGKVTRKLPKPLVSIEGKPILEHLIELCRAHGVTTFLVNLHHLPDAIQSRLGDGSRWGVKIRYKRERVLLGTAGAVKNFEAELGKDPFFVLYGDNHMDYDLKAMLARHVEKRADMTLAVFELPDTRQSGAVTVAADGRVTSFVEKRAAPEPTPGLVNAGLYVMNPSLVKTMRPGFGDFGRDAIPRFIAAGRRVMAMTMDHPVKAIDTPVLYRRWAQEAP